MVEGPFADAAGNIYRTRKNLLHMFFRVCKTGCGDRSAVSPGGLMKQQWTANQQQDALHSESGDFLRLSHLPYVFDGPFIFPENLLAEPGVFVIFSPRKASVCYIGEGTNVKILAMQMRDSHNWGRKRPTGTIYYTATYTGESVRKRKVIEKQLRMTTSPREDAENG